jgi:hypothetical protein
MLWASCSYENGAAVGGDGVAQHLQGHRRLAQALGPTEQDQLTRAEPPGQGHVEGVEPGGEHPRPGGLALAQLLVGLREDISERAKASLVA